MSWRIVVISKRAKLDLQLGQMVVRGEEVTKIVLSEISTILIESTAVSLTTISYQEVKALFIEDQERSCMEGGRRYIIDTDGCEIY